MVAKKKYVVNYKFIIRLDVDIMHSHACILCTITHCIVGNRYAPKPLYRKGVFGHYGLWILL